MTGRERMLAALRGDPVDRKPELRMPLGENELPIIAVKNPFGYALDEGFDLNGEIQRDPNAGAERLESYFESTRANLRRAFTEGADAVLYALNGAESGHCTPMQYGGFYLERDRELLEEAVCLGPILLLIVGGEGTYLDFVSDLPAHAFAWDSDATGVSAKQIRATRSGPLCSQDPDSDILLIPSIAGRPIQELLNPEAAIRG